MKVTDEMLHPQVREMGVYTRETSPKYTEEIFRSNLEALNQRNETLKPTFAQMEKIWLDRPDGSRMRCLVLKPENAAPGLPAVLFLHGGGYIGGSPEDKIWFVERLLGMADAVFFSPDYALALDNPYPAALEDAYQALLWLKEHAVELGANPDQLFIVGESAGGGLAAGLAIYARDKGEVNVAFQMPLFPMLDDRIVTDSMRCNDAPVWNEDSNRLAWQLYLQNVRGETPVYAAPARLEDFAGLPPAYTYVGTVDPFYDETRHYFARLREAGIEARCDFYEGCYHAFDELNPDASIVQRCNDNLRDAFRYACRTYFAPQK